MTVALPFFTSSPADRLSNKKAVALILLATNLLSTSLAQPGMSQGIDRIRRRTGSDSGKITTITPLGVAVSRSGTETNVPSEEIVMISFAGEPNELGSVRNDVLARRYGAARDTLKAIDRKDVQREEILTELEFYEALVHARLALAGDSTIGEARSGIENFLTKRRTSFHVPDAIELLGDLAVSAGDFVTARNQYAKLAKAQAPYYQIRSAFLTGQAWQAEGDHAAAIREFDRALADKSEAPILESIHLDVRLGRAVSEAATGGVADATREVGAIIANAKATDDKLLARAYNALGDCYLQSGDQKGALYSYLHVDLLYPQSGQEHARALRHLVSLWKALGQAERSQEAADILNAKYPAEAKSL